MNRLTFRSIIIILFDPFKLCLHLPSLSSVDILLPSMYTLCSSRTLFFRRGLSTSWCAYMVLGWIWSKHKTVPSKQFMDVLICSFTVTSRFYSIGIDQSYWQSLIWLCQLCHSPQTTRVWYNELWKGEGNGQELWSIKARSVLSVQPM